jgi:hypothetical protein
MLFIYLLVFLTIYIDDVSDDENFINLPSPFEIFPQFRSIEDVKSYGRGIPKKLYREASYIRKPNNVWSDVT